MGRENSGTPVGLCEINQEVGLCEINQEVPGRQSEELGRARWEAAAGTPRSSPRAWAGRSRQVSGRRRK